MTEFFNFNLGGLQSQEKSVFKNSEFLPIFNYQTFSISTV